MQQVRPEHATWKTVISNHWWHAKWEFSSYLCTTKYFPKSVEYVKWCSLLLPMAGHKTGHVFKNNWKIKIRLSSGRGNSDSKLNKPLILMFVLWWWKMEMYNHWLFMYRCCLCYGIQNIYVAFQANVKCKKDSLLLWHLLLLFFKK